MTEVEIEHALLLVAAELVLGKGSPLLAEALDRLRIDIGLAHREAHYRQREANPCGQASWKTRLERWRVMD